MRKFGVLFGLILLGLALRSLFLDWQPLWWDEGYSVYFATEPLPRMVWLTAHDIHPPLYYALLHAWITLFGSAAPLVDRTFSVLVGMAALPLIYWLAVILFPGRRRILLIALFLLAFSPMHIYYSQEVRMYGLAMALGIVSSGCLWLMVRRAERTSVRLMLFSWPTLGYVIAATTGLYTLYYLALLLLAHMIWAGLHFRRRLSAALGVLGVQIIVGILYLPWVFYALPKLVTYVAGKVKSDQDTALGALEYLARHLTAFAAGHVRTSPVLSFWLPLSLVVAAITLLALAAFLGRNSRRDAPPESSGAAGALWVWLLTPLVAGWLINLATPFFPEGGERLLLIVLPYYCLLVAYGIDLAWTIHQLGKLALGILAASAALGITIFYIVPRYDSHDYRPIIRQIVQQGTDQDTMLAIFPWQIGYWRAYTPHDDPLLRGPHALLLADDAIVWNADVRAKVDQALGQGTLWFPEPLSFGSTLPEAVERYLQQTAVNLENRWYQATRLTAWRPLPSPTQQAIGADYGPLRLVAAGLEPGAVASANEPVAISLTWETVEDVPLNASLRIQDKDGHVWSSRDYELASTQTMRSGGIVSETIGLITPVGLPPGAYTVTVGVHELDRTGQSGRPLTVHGSDAVAVPIGALEITQPGAPQSPARLPIQTPLEHPAAFAGLELLGFAGAGDSRPVLAGTEMALTLFLQNRSAEPPQRSIYVSLLDKNGAGVAGYEGWPLPAYAMQTWPDGALVQLPVAFYVSGALSSGPYRLVAGLIDPESGEKTPPVELATIDVAQRKATFTRPAPTHTLPEPAQFGTHARLIGYDLQSDGEKPIELRLYWEILQPLLPPHHIFVHADAGDGATLTQQDGPPIAPIGPAPTGSWQPGEFLTTLHTIRIPSQAGAVLHVGLYDPQTGVRLPVTIAANPAGDSVALPWK